MVVGVVVDLVVQCVVVDVKQMCCLGYVVFVLCQCVVYGVGFNCVQVFVGCVGLFCLQFVWGIVQVVGQVVMVKDLVGIVECYQCVQVGVQLVYVVWLGIGCQCVEGDCFQLVFFFQLFLQVLYQCGMVGICMQWWQGYVVVGDVVVQVVVEGVGCYCFVEVMMCGVDQCEIQLYWFVVVQW